MKIKDQRATLTNHNSRTEGKDDSLTPAVDLSFKCIADSEVAEFLLACDGKPPLWLDNEDNDSAFIGMEHIVCWGTYSAKKVSFAGIVIKDCKLKKFSFKVVAGNKIELKFQVAFTNPNEKQLYFQNLIKHIGTLNVAYLERDIDDEDDDQIDLLDGESDG